MRNAYRILASIIAVEVVIQAMMIVFAVAGLGKYIEDGAVVDKAAFEDEDLSFTGVAGFMIHGINGTLVNATPSRTVAEQDAELGPRLYGRNPDLCCYLRKVEPLERALGNYDAWITGVRRDETVERREAKVVEWDGRREMVKVNPIASWSGKQVDDYIAENGILVNPLVYDGYPSIGCATCTRKVAPGENPRAGRWAGTGKTECGIHL